MAWRDYHRARKKKAHITSREFPRKIPVRGQFLSDTVFNHFPLEGFSQTNGNWLVGAPRAHFRQKLQIDKFPDFLFYHVLHKNWDKFWAKLSPL